MGLTVHFEVLNQLGTPMMYSATLANRPAAGIAGRIFFRTDSPYGIFRDTGSAWDQISSAGGGNTIYTGDDTLTSNRTVSSGGFTLVFTPQTTFFSSLNAAINASSFAVLGSNTLTYAAAFSSNNIGNVYSANGAINSQIFVGNATFAQANLASAMVNVNKIDFSSGGHTVTMTQSTGIRAMTGVQNQIQFVGSHNGTITHAAVSQNLGFFRDTGSTRTLTITNAYSHLINALDDYGAGFTFTNRWGIYQAGVTDKNYFSANSLFGQTVDSGEKVQITGTAKITGILNVAQNTGTFLQNTIANNSWFSDGNTALRINKAGNSIYNFDNFGNLQASSATLQIITAEYNLDGGGTNVYNSRFWAYVAGVNRNMNNQSRQVMQITSTGGGSVINGPKLSFLDISRGNATGFTAYVGIDVIDCEVRLNSTSGSTIVGGSSINGSAKFQVDSVTQGILFPRMTTAQKNAIGTPAAGLVIYDTTLNKLCVYTTAWETVTSI
jgi:hypothetical protein